MSEQAIEQVEALLDAAAEAKEAEVIGNPQSQDQPENAEFRLKAAQRQQKKAEARAKELESRLLGIEAKLSNSDEPESKEEIDLESELKALKEEISGMKQVQRKANFEKRDKNFFINHPDLNPEQVSSEVVQYLEDKPGLRDSLLKGEVEIEDVYNAITGRKNRTASKADVQEADVVMGSQAEPIAPRNSTKQASELDEARAVLADPESRTKRQASKVVQQHAWEIMQEQMKHAV